MLFGGFAPELQPTPDRLALLDTVLEDFRLAFFDLHFELRLDRRVVNAQAIFLNGKRCVLIYGGLALNPMLAENSLTFVFLHEVGHHLAVGPRLPFNLSLACDCVADDWAAGEGSSVLYQRSGRRFEIGKALDELDHLMDDGHESEFYDSKEPILSCRNHQWKLRRSALEKIKSQTIRTCEFLSVIKRGTRHGIVY